MGTPVPADSADAEVRRFEGTDGQHGGKPLSAAEAQAEVRAIQQKFKDAPQGEYRRYIDAVYRGIKGDSQYASLLPVIDLTDVAGAPDHDTAIRDRGNFSDDPKKYGLDSSSIDSSGHATHWTDGHGNGIAASADGSTVNSFSKTDEGKIHVTTMVNGKPQGGGFDYPKDSIVAFNPNGSVDVQWSGDHPAKSHIDANGTEVTTLGNGVEVTRPFAGGDVTNVKIGKTDIDGENWKKLPEELKQSIFTHPDVWGKMPEDRLQNILAHPEVLDNIPADLKQAILTNPEVLSKMPSAITNPEVWGKMPGDLKKAILTNPKVWDTMPQALKDDLSKGKFDVWNNIPENHRAEILEGKGTVTVLEGGVVKTEIKDGETIYMRGQDALRNGGGWYQTNDGGRTWNYIAKGFDSDKAALDQLLQRGIH
jgi:hypothetical protein